VQWTFALGYHTIMATETGADHRIVIYSSDAPGGRSVAVLADRGRKNMGRIFPFGDRTVMAKHAVVVDIHMVELPVEGRMAVVADIVTCDMPGVFSSRYNAVMATKTAADDRGVIYPGHASPGVGFVTKIAVTNHPNMPARRRAGFYATRVRVTVDAAPGCADKYPLQVTGFASGQGVIEFQGKVGLVMIEFRPYIQRHGAARVEAN
jgi:hypothetical protein